MSKQMHEISKSGDSSSLWNVSIQSGWSPMEIKLLKAGVMKFGVGKWTDFYQAQIIPTKNIMNCYIQLQRIIGMQSLAGYMGLHIDIDAVAADNKAKVGKRKNGALVNEGDKLTKEQKSIMIAENHRRFGLEKAYIEQLKLPSGNKVRVYELNKIINAKRKMSISEKIENLSKVRQNLEKKLKILAEGREIIEFNYDTPQQWREKVARGEIKSSRNGEFHDIIIDDQNEMPQTHEQNPYDDRNQVDPFDSDVDEFEKQVQPQTNDDKSQTCQAMDDISQNLQEPFQTKSVNMASKRIKKPLKKKKPKKEMIDKSKEKINPNPDQPRKYQMRQRLATKKKLSLNPEEFENEENSKEKEQDDSDFDDDKHFNEKVHQDDDQKSDYSNSGSKKKNQRKALTKKSRVVT